MSVFGVGLCVCAGMQADKGAVTIRTRKFLTNRLLSRKQMVRCSFWVVICVGLLCGSLVLVMGPT